MRLRVQAARSVATVSNEEKRDALNGALEHFAELVRVLDEACTKAERANDAELIERLTRAKMAAERGQGIVGELCKASAEGTGDQLP
jgi:hypothetical protein